MSLFKSKPVIWLSPFFDHGNTDIWWHHRGSLSFLPQQGYFSSNRNWFISRVRKHLLRKLTKTQPVYLTVVILSLCLPPKTLHFVIILVSKLSWVWSPPPLHPPHMLVQLWSVDYAKTFLQACQDCHWSWTFFPKETFNCVIEHDSMSGVITSKVRSYQKVPPFFFLIF